MSDRSDEVTTSREPKSTDELLEETESLLSDSSGSSNSSAHTDERSAGTDGFESESSLENETGDSGSWMPSFGSEADSEPSAEPALDSSSSRLSSVTSLFSLPRLSPTQYFSPKAYFALVMVIGAGLFAGNTVIPFAGRMISMFAAAFLIGLLTSKRRYLEMTAAGVSVGVVAAMFNFTLFAMLGSGQNLLAVGTTTGALACLGGYYFGRDLKNGLARDVD
ncbi:DUF456 domain-containing protein [Halostagnicola sp. A-GB9-2]|uniref:DUF456 domain-containing protein n=1 Tax=Halostagnicola sp. A-GB9-2 TaxID=3048066 RepID=UPI0024BFDA04|nr:DUF456 domain-containing protein [Halostagnicola sp. A-GB9-2]MDJ1431203.1 DUF456 domain-containing protein [Halostagnicola sp. A-GB9-2]